MTQTTILVGTVDYPVAKKTVLREMDLVELTATHLVPVKIATAKKWRKEAGEGVAFSLEAPKYLFEPLPKGAPYPGEPKRYGGFLATEENLQLFADFMGVAEVFKARAIVFLTPAAFTPSMGNLEAMARFLSAVRGGDSGFCPDFVWEPKGPWTIEGAARFAAEQNLILAVDPLRDDPPEGPAAYFRFGPFSAMGSRMGLYDLERIKAAATPFSQVTAVFHTPKALDDARNLKKVLAEA